MSKLKPHPNEDEIITEIRQILWWHYNRSFFQQHSLYERFEEWLEARQK